MKRANMLQNWRRIVKRVVEAIKDVLPDAEVYVFGSIVKQGMTASSDMDLFIFSEKYRKNIPKMKIILEIEKKAGLPEYHPFEFHLVNKQEKTRYLIRFRKVAPINVS